MDRRILADRKRESIDLSIDLMIGNVHFTANSFNSVAVSNAMKMSEIFAKASAISCTEGCGFCEMFRVASATAFIDGPKVMLYPRRSKPT
jgi:hypothetical protein